MFCRIGSSRLLSRQKAPKRAVFLFRVLSPANLRDSIRLLTGRSRPMVGVRLVWSFGFQAIEARLEHPILHCRMGPDQCAQWSFRG